MIKNIFKYIGWTALAINIIMTAFLFYEIKRQARITLFLTLQVGDLIAIEEGDRNVICGMETILENLDNGLITSLDVVSGLWAMQFNKPGDAFDTFDGWSAFSKAKEEYKKEQERKWNELANGIEETTKLLDRRGARYKVHSGE